MGGAPPQGEQKRIALIPTMKTMGVTATRLLLIVAFLMSLAGFGNGDLIRYALILFLVAGIPCLAFFAYKNGMGNPRGLAVLIIATNASWWLSFLFWQLKKHLAANPGGVDPFAGIAAFWLLAFVALGLYELISLLNRLRYADKRRAAAVTAVAFALQFLTLYYLWDLVAGA